MIRIITDTASDITLAQANKMNITLLSLPVTFGELSYDQLKDDDFTQFYTLLASSKALPVTSLSSPGEYLAIFEEIKQSGDSAVVIPVSSKLSGSFQSAFLAKEMADYDDIYVVDGNQAVIGQRILTEYAVRLRDEGKSAKEISELVLQLSGRVRLYGALDTLKYLIKGRRISKGAGIVGSALNVKPIVFINEGAVAMAGKARGRDGAITAMLKHISESADFDPSFPFCFGYSKSKDYLDTFAAQAKEKFNLTDCMVYPVGGVVGTHAGPNAIVAAWVVKD